MTGRVFSIRVEIRVPSGKLEDAQRAVDELLPTTQTVDLGDGTEAEVTLTKGSDRVQVLVG